MFFVPLLSCFILFLKFRLITTKTKQMFYLWKFSRREQRSYTYHSFLPDDAHAILNTRKPVGDLCEIILPHGSLFDGEWTVVRAHNVQSVTAAKQSEIKGHIYYCSGGRNQKHFYILRDFIAFSSLSQQAH